MGVACAFEVLFLFFFSYCHPTLPLPYPIQIGEMIRRFFPSFPRWDFFGGFACFGEYKVLSGGYHPKWLYSTEYLHGGVDLPC